MTENMYTTLFHSKSLYTLSVAKIRNKKSIIPFSGDIISMKEGIIPNKEDYDIFLASLCFDTLQNGYFCSEQACKVQIRGAIIY